MRYPPWFLSGTQSLVPSLPFHPAPDSAFVKQAQRAMFSRTSPSMPSSSVAPESPGVLSGEKGLIHGKTDRRTAECLSESSFMGVMVCEGGVPSPPDWNTKTAWTDAIPGGEPGLLPSSSQSSFLISAPACAVLSTTSSDTEVLVAQSLSSLSPQRRAAHSHCWVRTAGR